MKHIILSEKSKPSSTSVNIIHESIEKIKPDFDSLNQWYDRYSNRQKKRLAFDLDYLIHYAPHESTILEVGSIPPILTLGARRLGYKIQGVDISPERFGKAIKLNNLDIRKLDVETENLDFQSSQFDIVLFNEIFEHLRINPIHTFEEIHRVLKANGKLMLSTPNFLALRSLKSLIIYSKGRSDIYTEYSKLQKLGHMGHVRLYTAVEVSIFLEKIGFEIQQIVYRGTSDEATWKGILENNIFRILPKLRPFFSIVAQKK